MGTKDQRHQHLRRRAAQTDRHHHHHRDQGSDRAVHADHRSQDADKSHHQHDQPRAAFPRLTDQQLAGPGGHARHLQPGRNHEKGSNENDSGVAKAGKGLLQRQNSRGPQGQCRADAHGNDRQAVPCKKHHDCGNDQKYGPDIRHVTLPLILSAMMTETGEGGQPDSVLRPFPISRLSAKRPMGLSDPLRHVRFMHAIVC